MKIKALTVMIVMVARKAVITSHKINMVKDNRITEMPAAVKACFKHSDSVIRSTFVLLDYLDKICFL